MSKYILVVVSNRDGTPSEMGGYIAWSHTNNLTLFVFDSIEKARARAATDSHFILEPVKLDSRLCRIIRKRPNNAGCYADRRYTV
jgi:hypothetical protein